MAPRGREVALGRAPARSNASAFSARNVYQTLTSAENRTVVTSVAFFAAGVAFLHSSWAEILLPPV